MPENPIAAINSLPVQPFTTEAAKLINDGKISLRNGTLLNHVPAELQNSVLFQAQTMAEKEFAEYLLLLPNPKVMKLTPKVQKQVDAGIIGPENATLLRHLPASLQDFLILSAARFTKIELIDAIAVAKRDRPDLVGSPPPPEQDIIDALCLSARVTLEALRDRGVLDNQMSLSAILEALKP